MEATLCLELQIKTLLTCSTIQVPLYNGYEALDVKSPSVGDNRPLRLDKPTKPNLGKPSCNIKAASSKKRWVLVVDDSSLQGTECWAEPLHREAGCLSGAWVKDVTRKLPSLVQVTDHKSLLLLHTGRDEPATLWIKGHQKGLRTMAEGIESIRSSFSSLPPVLGDKPKDLLSKYLSLWLVLLPELCFWQQNGQVCGYQMGLIFLKRGEGSFKIS